MSPDHTTPEAVFADAQASIAAGDLAAAFACFDRADRSRMADNSVRAVSAADAEFDDKRAWAARVERRTEVDDIGFVRKRDGWKIKLFARRPAR